MGFGIGQGVTVACDVCGEHFGATEFVPTVFGDQETAAIEVASWGWSVSDDGKRIACDDCRDASDGHVEGGDDGS